jgi:hypothetical protein
MDIADQLQKLHQLHESGALSNEEFAAAKRAVITGSGRGKKADGGMWLTTESGTLPDVTAEGINNLRPIGELGNFAQLFASETNFIQAAPEVPGRKREAFLREHGSVPWLLQQGYGDEKPGQMFQAAGLFTWDQVRQAFLSFLAGGEEWRRQFTWAELPPTPPGKPWWSFG